MDQYELLVHVSAAARVEDDRRYLSIAQSIIDFEAASVTRVASDTERFMNIYDTDLSDEVEGTPGQDYSRSSEPTPSRDPRRIAQTKIVASPADCQRKKPGLQQVSNGRRISGHNPPYRNPYHGPLAQASQPNPRTPQPDSRPQTAPDKLERTVQVPFTGIGKRRTNSESASFGSLTSWVSDSQRANLEPPFVSQPNPKSTIEESFIQDSMAADRSLTQSFSQTSIDDEPRRKRVRLSRDQSAGVLQDRPSDSDPYFVRDRSLDWTSSPTCSEESRTDSVPSTASLSQPLPTTGGSFELNSTSEAQPQATQYIDLTLTSSSQNSGAKAPPSPKVGNISSSIDRDESSSQLAAQKTNSGLFGANVAVEVRSGDPPTGQTKFTSHVTPPLADLAARLPFEQSFRPVEVKRDVAVFERGFWVMEVTLADAEVVSTARRSPSREQKMQSFHDRFAGATHDIRMKRYEAARQSGELSEFDYGFEDKAVGLLTEEEFLVFWKNMSLFIEDGKAGWGIRMVREEMDLDSSDIGKAKIRIRIFSWGEIIGHLYLAFWILSDKVMERVVMEWVAGDGTMVVKMAGTRAGRGKLGVWTRKGGVGEGGCWGVVGS